MQGRGGSVAGFSQSNACNAWGIKGLGSALNREEGFHDGRSVFIACMPCWEGSDGGPDSGQCLAARASHVTAEFAL